MSLINRTEVGVRASEPSWTQWAIIKKCPEVIVSFTWIMQNKHSVSDRSPVCGDGGGGGQEFRQVSFLVPKNALIT